MTKVELETINLTPEMAQKFMSKNPNNRAIVASWVRKLTSDIVNDRWEFNGEPIIVADTGELNDGQHRCMAVIAADKAVKTVLITGVPRESRTTIDMGAARTAAHILGMEGYAHTSVLARVAGLLLAYEKKSKIRDVGSDGAHTKQEVLDYFREHADEIQTAEPIYTDKRCRALATESMLAFVYILLRRKVNLNDLEVFFESLLSGANLDSDSPVLELRNRLITARNATPSKLSNRQVFELLIRGWNINRTGEGRLAVFGRVPPIEN